MLSRQSIKLALVGFILAFFNAGAVNVAAAARCAVQNGQH
jgi:hypothetical protein